MSGLVKGTTESDRHLQNYSCSVARHLAEYVFSERGRELSGFLFYNACDTLRNLPEVLERGLKEQGRALPRFRLHVPAARPGSGYSRDYLAREITRLADELGKASGSGFSEAKFRESVELYRKLRKALLDLETEAGRGALSFADYQEFALAVLRIPVEEAALLAGSKLEALRKSPSGKPGPRIMVSGILAPPAPLVRAMEAAGLRVCANDLASLHRSLAYTPEPFAGPAEYYLDFYQNHFPCPTLLPTADQRLGALLSLAREREIKGVVFAGEKFCEYEFFEYPWLEKRLNQEGIKTLVLELAIGDEAWGALRTRIEAFAEILARG